VNALYFVQVEEFGHLETEHRIAAEKVSGKFKRQFRLANPGRAEEEEGTERFVGRLQSEFATFEHRTDAGDDVLLAFDFGEEVRFEGIEFFDIGIHGFSMGLIFLPRSHWRRA